MLRPPPSLLYLVIYWFYIWLSIWFCTFVLYLVRRAGVYIVFVYFKECYHTQFQLKLILISKRT